MSHLQERYRFTGLLVVGTLVWGFLVPIVHLACGMQVDDAQVMCGEQPAHHGAHGSPSAVHPLMDGHGEGHAASHVGGEADDMSLECCRVESAVYDGVAPRLAVDLSPDITISPLELPAPDETSVDFPAARLNDESSPPIAFRLVFSVFLI